MLITLNNIESVSQCPNSGVGVWGATAPVGIQTDMPAKPLHILGTLNCPDPAIRLEYQPYMGHIVLLTPANLNQYSILGTPGDMTLQADVNAGDLLLTTRNNTSSIRFATTPFAQGPDIERMTITSYGGIGIDNTLPVEELQIGKKMSFHRGANFDFIGYNDYLGGDPIQRRYITFGYDNPPVNGYASCIEFRNEWKQTGLRIAAPGDPGSQIDYTEPLVQGDYYGGEKGIWLGLSDNQNHATVGIGASAPIDTRLYIRSMGNNTSDYYTLQCVNKSNNPLLVVNDNGNVGIGTFTPSQKLVIKGNTSDANAASLNVTNSSDASLLFVRDDGNVGIGFDNPQQRLSVDG